MTSPPRWRDTEAEQFAAAILTAADQLGVLPLAVEKDYWVCQALRAITRRTPARSCSRGERAWKSCAPSGASPKTSTCWSSATTAPTGLPAGR